MFSEREQKGSRYNCVRALRLIQEPWRCLDTESLYILIFSSVGETTGMCTGCEFHRCCILLPSPQLNRVSSARV